MCRKHALPGAWRPSPTRSPARTQGTSRLDKTRWGVMTGSRFLGPMYPLVDLSSTVQKEVEWQSSLTTKSGLFAMWKLESGLWCRDTVLVLDDDATRHLHWQPKAWVSRLESPWQMPRSVRLSTRLSCQQLCLLSASQWLIRRS